MFAPIFLTFCTIAQQPTATQDPTLANRIDEATTKALAYLAASQAADGGWQVAGTSHPAISALVLKALAQDSHYGPNHPAVRRGVEYVMKFAQSDGGIYREEDGHKNYHTSVVLMMLASLKDPAQEKSMKAAQDFLRTLQWDEGEGHERNSPWYGGAGYGRGKRPDLSNTQMMIEALHESGLPPDDPAYKKALVFIQRCQMLGSTNDQPFAAGSQDGGFIYTPANDGESMAGTEVVGDRPRLRSYGSMTYAAFKSMLYAKVDRDDARVKAAVDWIRRNYTLDHNPNMPGEQSKQGLYYFYYVFAKALAAWGEETIADAAGDKHAWRNELAGKLLSLQRPDGSWFNEADRWMESNPYLVTAYAVLTLQTITNQPM
jgi:squalene-hopene/tetraprenyl-beta-curcumene cyclase